MSSEPSYPKDAAIGGGEAPLNETLGAAVTAKEAAQRAKESRSGNRNIVRGAAIGVGSAALVAALLYASRSRKPDRKDPDPGPAETD